MNEVLNHLPDLKGVHQETIRLDQSFEQIAASFADDEGSVLLLSGSGLDCSRYHILAAAPWLEVKSYQENVSIRYQEQKFEITCDPFLAVATLLDKFSLDNNDFYLPVHAGLFGYFSYDLKDQIETLPVTCMDTHLPDLCLYAPTIILVQDKLTNETQLCIPLFDHELSDHKLFDHKLFDHKLFDHSSDMDNTQLTIQKTRDFFFEKISNSVERQSFSLDHKGFNSSFTKSEYIESVEKVIEYLRVGDIYQANLSQRFEAGFSGDTYALFLDLFDRNPAAFFSYIHAGDHTIVSTSPERFIKREGKYIQTRPIKGTIARGSTQVQDEENGRILSQSAKDDAELTMIVDLMRNDLSRVTKHGSVIVSEHKCVESYENVFHLVSVVQGELKENKSSVDLLKATFPGGSITGCPKIRSMEIIDELEPIKRHVYTGSIGYISFHDTMDLSIAIRTATISDQRIFFSVGGGIVYDSDPEKEYQETLDKGKTLLETLSGKQIKTSSPKIKAWVDGKLIDQDLAMVSANSTGFQYGAGIFETIRVEKGQVFRLENHVARMNLAWQSLFEDRPPDISWDVVIQLLVRENNFEAPILAIKIIVSKDELNSGKKYFLAAFARPYTHRLELLDKNGLDLMTYPKLRQTPLADYKTLNYLYYEQAMRYAKVNGADEAVILNADQSISETNTASILSIDGNTVWVPQSSHVLPGVTQKSVLTILADKGYDIRKKRIPKDEFYSYPNIILSNALMGAVKVLSIDKKQVEHTQDICLTINKQLFDL